MSVVIDEIANNVDFLKLFIGSSVHSGWIIVDDWGDWIYRRNHSLSFRK